MQPGIRHDCLCLSTRHMNSPLLTILLVSSFSPLPINWIDANKWHDKSEQASCVSVSLQQKLFLS